MPTKSASKTSSGKRARERARVSGLKYSLIRDIRILHPTPYTGGRKREARRWLEVLAARCTNGARCANPISIAESARLHQQAMDDLERSDKELFDAVHQCIWDRMVADEGITMAEWQVRALRRARRVSAIRATLR
jgi:hypothetical protein